MKFNVEIETQYDDRVKTVIKAIAKAELRDNDEHESVVDSWTDEQTKVFMEAKLHKHLVQLVRQYELALIDSVAKQDYKPVE